MYIKFFKIQFFLPGVEIPEGVDPSFLAALPDNIRQEVIAEQLRLQRLRQRSLNVSSDNTNEGASFTEVNPEFLAALPVNIQEEVSFYFYLRSSLYNVTTLSKLLSLYFLNQTYFEPEILISKHLNRPYIFF